MFNFFLFERWEIPFIKLQVSNVFVDFIDSQTRKMMANIYLTFFALNLQKPIALKKHFHMKNCEFAMPNGKLSIKILKQ